MAEQPPDQPRDQPRDQPPRPPADDETVVVPADETVVAEEWAVPPERRVAVEETQTVPPRRPIPRLWPGLLALLLLVLGGLAAAYFLSQDDDEPARTATTAAVAEVPVLVGLREARAEERAREAGFEPKVERAASGKPKGVVFEQDPAPGAELAKGRELLLRVSTGPPREEVPDVVGQPFDEARGDLEAAELKVARRDAFGDAEKGVVLRQEPAGGEKLRKGGTVTLTVSRGPEPAEVPDVTGTSSSEATATLRDAGFDVSIVGVPSQEPAGTVVAQDPAAGEQAPKGSSVRLNVAQGGTGATTTATTTTTTTTTTQPQTTSVPDAAGKELADAAREFARAGLKVAVAYVPNEEQPGRVVAQARPAGTEARRGDTVQLNVSTGPQPAPAAAVPNAVGRTLQQGRSALESAGFEVLALDWRGGRIANESPVRSQSPAARAQVPGGSLVLLYVNS